MRVDFSSSTRWTFIAFLLLIPWCIASTGDQLPEFINCVDACTLKNCRGTHQVALPLHLKLFFWNCASECDYVCQRSITASRIADNLPIEQFHGKWPFRRLFGIQEPFSLLFSILNGYQHLLGLRAVRYALPRTYPMRRYYVLMAYVGMACWTFSSIFHTRDYILTERLDYFAAGANILYGLYLAPIRIFKLYRPSKSHYIPQWTAVCLLAYAGHVYFMQFVRWDYTYNMAANVVVGFVQNTLWTYFAFSQYRKTGEIWRLTPFAIVLLLTAAMSLELLDFPPWMDALDAHALWHGSTILLTLIWYKFLIKDGRHDLMHGRLKT